MERSQVTNEWTRFLNMWFGFSYVLVPIALMTIYGRWKHKRGKLGRGPASRFLKSFAVGHPRQRTDSSCLEDSRYDENNDFTTDCIWLTFYSFGLVGSLWITGLLQERIITQPYSHISNTVELDVFEDMQFLVFCNRLAGLLLASCGYLYLRKRHPVHVPPYFFHGYTSIANILSSWFQYTALKFVSFPVVTMSKSGKVSCFYWKGTFQTAAIMIMDRFIRGQRHSWVEYATAGGIATGASLFIVNSSDESKSISSTTISGLFLILGYLVFDSFTSTWQKALFEKPKISRAQMMLGVNFFSAMLSLVSLIGSNGLLTNIDFALNHKYFLEHTLWLSVASAISQIFIYGLIDNYGATTFSLVLTSRQVSFFTSLLFSLQIGSILISTLFYGHPLPSLSVLGLIIVFSSVFLLTYFRYSKKKAYKTIS